MQQYFYGAYPNYGKIPTAIENMWFIEFVVSILIIFN